MKKLVFGFILLAIQVIAFIAGITLLICGAWIYIEMQFYIAEPMLLFGAILTAFGFGGGVCLLGICLMED